MLLKNSGEGKTRQGREREPDGRGSGTADQQVWAPLLS